MLGELHGLALGPVTPAISSIFAALGCLLGAVLAARARTCTGGRRFRLLVYATISVAGATIWLPAVVAVLGLQVDGSVLRVNPQWLALSLAAMTAATAAALLLLCYGRRGAGRLISGGILLAAGAAAGADLMLRSLSTGGHVVVAPSYSGAGLTVAVVAAFLLSLLLGAAPTLRWASLMSVLVGLLLVAAYLVASAGLSVAPGPAGAIPADEVVGLTPMAIGLPAIVLGGVLLAMIWYFTVGTATRRDLRLIFDPAGADAIEPWMIEQVQLRVALGSTAFAPVTEWGARVGSEATVAVRSIPLLGGAVASAFSRGVREYRGAPPPGPVPGPAHHEDAEPPTLDWPAEPPTIDWPADAPTLDSPRWRPVPGWGLPNVTRSVLTPVGTSQGTRPGNLRDEREWPGDRNEQRAATRARSTNSRQGDFPSRSPYPELVLVNGDEPTWAPTMADEPSPPLPRRNTGR